MSKLIAKIIDSQSIFGSECSYFKTIFRAAINYVYTEFYNIMRLVYPLPMDDSVECQIQYQKNRMYFPDHFDNIMNYV